MSTKMKCVTFDQPGGPEVLHIGEADIPSTLGPNEVLVEVHYTALNRADTLQRRGRYPAPPGESTILGLELSGVITAIGSEVQSAKIGQNVCALVGGGGYAEYCKVDAGSLIHLPEDYPLDMAACIPEAFLTAHEMMIELGKLKKGERVLVHAGASGVGSTAIQMAQRMGCTVFTTIGSAEKAEKLCSSLSLDKSQIILYKEVDDFAEEIVKRSGTGVDVVLDFIGGSYLAKNIKALNMYGRLVFVGTMGGATGELDISLVMRKKLTIAGSTMRARSLKDKAEARQRFDEHWRQFVFSSSFSSGSLEQMKPIIDCVMPWEKAAEAHQRMEDNLNFGKIVLKVR